ncbi:hypothetical protein, partial [Aurantimonas manganoxydans]|uniref:hypothetical protein n=1 Tax=Aurantimonas manganoxydans TaxID=651183 RepID=UPI001AECD099
GGAGHRTKPPRGMPAGRKLPLRLCNFPIPPHLSLIGAADGAFPVAERISRRDICLDGRDQ